MPLQPSLESSGPTRSKLDAHDDSHDHKGEDPESDDPTLQHQRGQFAQVGIEGDAVALPRHGLDGSGDRVAAEQDAAGAGELGRLDHLGLPSMSSTVTFVPAVT